MSNLLSIILVALLGVVGNIIYFHYQTRKQFSKEILKKRLTDLLLPLFFELKKDNLILEYCIQNDSLPPEEHVSGRPRELLNKLEQTIRQNIYLADNELHKGCIEFLEWAYAANTDDRWARIHETSLEEDKALGRFVQLVDKKYHETRKRFLR